MSIFTQIQQSAVPSNTFDLSHDVKMSLDMGVIYPVNCMECIPGDQIRMSSQLMARMAPMIAPVMHKVDIDIHHFFVPNRIVWAGWEKFITTGTPDAQTPAAPYFFNMPSIVGSLADYLGCPVPANGIITKVSAIPFAGYHKIWNEYYRDQNLQEPVSGVDLVDGQQPSGSSLWQINRRAWEHDYFTSSLPWAQKGDAVTIPLGLDAPIVMSQPPNSVRPQGKWVNSLNQPFPNVLTELDIDADGFTAANAIADLDGDQFPLTYDPNGSLKADLTDASAVTINALRWAVRLQEYLERNARGGTRYIEHILSHFGVHSSDKRLQRPEFLGGSRQHMVISEVLQNAPSTSSEPTPQGNMAGHGISVGGGKNFTYYVEEHGYTFSLMSIRPKTAYQQGLPRHFSRFDPLQYAWPTFANLGEQEVLNQELYYDNLDGMNTDTFGYTPRYSEYKYLDGRVAGEFKTNLAYWHLGRIFSSRPHLNESFVSCDPSNRIFAVEEGAQHIYMHILHDIKVRRRLPKFGIPTL